jgi:2-polyprenyl-6-methoxyphenol hydroxylase-like FAD-dependent oxidoreductase
MTHDVVIVGAGPAGLMLAGELSLAGAGVVVLDQLPQPNPRSLGVAINANVVELLRMRGLMDACSADGFDLPGAHFAQLWLDPAKVTDRHPGNFVLPQPRLEHHLAEWATRLGAEIRRGHRFTGLTQDGESVTVRARSDDGDYTIEAAYLVGCDGTGSAVRTAAGIPFPGSETPFHGIVAELPSSQQALAAHFGAHEYPMGLFTVSPAGPTVIRVMTGAFGVEPPHRDTAPSIDELRRSIQDIAGHDIAITEADWMTRWYHVTRNAERYRAGRVFLAGEAAHTHFPLGGLAISIGVEDAVNLGWKLAAVLAGQASDRLLDSYHDERHPVGARACRTAQAQVALLYPLTTVAPLREIMTDLIRFDDVNDYLVRLAAGTDVRYAVAGGEHELLGVRLPTVALSATGPRELADAWRAGRAVLLDLGAGRVDLEGWAGQVEVITAKPMPELGVDALLLRPDGRVVWVNENGAPDRDGLVQALRTWLGEPDRSSAAPAR